MSAGTVVAGRRRRPAARPARSGRDTGVCPEPRPVLKRAEQPAELPTHVRADEADSVQDGLSEFRGNVEMTHGQSRLRADQATYDSGTDITEARGNVVLDNETGDSYRTQYLTMHGETRRGHATAGSYTLQSNDARGDMQRVDFLDRDHTKLTQVRYTTCAPGQDDWFVYAPEIQIDNIEEMGYVRNAGWSSRASRSSTCRAGRSRSRTSASRAS